MKDTMEQESKEPEVPCFILVGGRGTRLRPLLPDAPKPMALIAGKPFLEYILTWVERAGFRHVVLCAGYLARQIQDRLGKGEKFGLRLDYSLETQPLGTWGAVRHARKWVQGSDFLVLNGDSWVDVDLRQFLHFHRTKGAVASIALANVSPAGRFGSVRLDANGNGKIVEFNEKEAGAKATLVNAGVYVFAERVFQVAPPTATSLEREVFPALVGKGLYGLVVPGKFIDIGLPEDYKRVCRDPEAWLGKLCRSGGEKTPC